MGIKDATHRRHARASWAVLLGMLLPVLVATGLAHSAPPTAGDAPRATLSTASVVRSGRIEIVGSGFGSGGTLRIGGLPAFTTLWEEARIVGYVPEGAPLGATTVEVEPATGPSGRLPLTVTAREQSGRLRWSFELTGLYSFVRPVLAPDGTIYAIDVYENLYALSPAGALLWVVSDAGNKGLARGADGTLYVSSENDVKAYNPDGSHRWTFTQSPRAFINLGLAIGPDGNLYSVSSSGMGVFSLTTGGALRWQLPEPYNRPNVIYSDILFGPGPSGQPPQLYFAANAHGRAVSITGEHRFYLSSAPPSMGPDGNVRAGGFAYSPSGELLWQSPTFMSAPSTVGSNNVTYGVGLMLMSAVDGDGSELWVKQMTDYVGTPAVDPLDRQVVVSGRSSANQWNSVLASFSTAGGAPLWIEFLPAVDEVVMSVTTQAIFTPDGDTAYVHTALGGSNGRGFLYAFDSSLSGGPTPTPTMIPPSATATAFPPSATATATTVPPTPTATAAATTLPPVSHRLFMPIIVR